MSRELTPAERFAHDLNLLSRGLRDVGLYWRGDLAQFAMIGKNLIHTCGHMIPLERGERRLDMIAMIAQTHLEGCDRRQGQSATRPAAEPSDQPGTTS